MFAQVINILWKILLVIISCYLAVAFLIFFLKPKKIEKIQADTYPLKLLRLSLRPIMDLAFDQRLSQEWDWNEIKVDAYRSKESQNQLVKVGSPIEPKRNFMDLNWWEINNTNQSVLLQPQDPNQNTPWQLIRCVEISNILYCQKNDILIKDVVKTSIYKDENNFIGIDQKGNYVPLKQVQIINSSQRKDIIYL